jgi:methyl-accepting chemotaxis protein
MNDADRILEAIGQIKTEIGSVHAEINSLRTDMNAKVDAVNMRLDNLGNDVTGIKECVIEIDDSIGIFSEWAEKVADKVNVPFLEHIT